jgi:type I restriction enzyme S subunit
VLDIAGLLGRFFHRLKIKGNNKIMSINTKTLGELCDQGGGFVRTGPFGTQLHESDYSEFGTPVIMPKDIIGCKVSEQHIARINDYHTERLKEHKLLVGDIVYGRRGDIGRQALISEKETGWLCGTGCLRITLGKKSELDSTFLHYFLRDEKVIASISKQAVGATMPNLNTRILKNINIVYPEKITQQKIASILSAYDDLIENNTRRIQILEEIARRIYEEWFVHFRFPNHENIKLIDSELGLIPEGWKISTVEDTFSILGGGTPSKNISEYWENGTINWYSPTDLTRNKMAFIDESSLKITPLGLTKSSARLFPAFSVMLTSRATIGVVAINTSEASTNQGFIICIPNEKFPLYVLFHWLKYNVEMFINLSSGATFKEISKGTFKQIAVLIAPSTITSTFQDMIDPIMKNLLNLQRKNEILKQTRDLLLPKLISGEIDVSEFPDAS